MANERNRDFGGGQSQGSEHGGADRRDPGADALLELARMIGGQGDPFAPETPKVEPRMSEPGTSEPRMSAPRASEPRLGDVSRVAAQETSRDPYVRSLQDRYDQLRAEPPARDNFDFPGSSGRGDYPIAPRQAPADGRDFDAGGRAPYRRRREDDFHEEYDDGNYAEPEEYDDGEGGAKRRRPTKTILAVLGLAVFGSMAAYGYRQVMNAAPSGPTPIIKADNSPTKITPMSDVRADNGRVGGRAEQLVRRDEEPVDFGSGGASDAVPAAGATAPGGDAKRVHTVPISAGPGASPSPRAVAAPAAVPAPPPAPRQAAAAPVQPASPRMAAVAPVPSETAPATVESGGYVVQLVALRSETDAQTEFRRLQGKYSSVLSGRQPLIRRKDQGERGIFFVAQVGPFGAKSEADQLCEQLKSAGGQCFVQRN
jgi:cell division septation protein DedD